MWSADTSSSELVNSAYRLLKQDSYYDKMQLFLRENIAAYEASGSFHQRQDALPQSLTSYARGHQARQAIKAWQEHVDFRLLPESMALQSTHEKQNLQLVRNST